MSDATLSDREVLKKLLTVCSENGEDIMTNLDAVVDFILLAGFTRALGRRQYDTI